MELRYTKESKITDYAVTLFGEHPCGVSVTRAINWPHFYLEAADAYRYEPNVISVKTNLGESILTTEACRR